MSKSKADESGQVTGLKSPVTADPVQAEQVGSPVSLRVLFALLFFGCTGYLMFSEVLHTLLRMMGVNH